MNRLSANPGLGRERSLEDMAAGETGSGIRLAFGRLRRGGSKYLPRLASLWICVLCTDNS